MSIEKIRVFLKNIFLSIDRTYMYLGKFLRADYLHSLLFSSFAMIQLYFLYRGDTIPTGLDIITGSSVGKFLICVFLIYFSIFILMLKNDYTIIISQILIYMYVFSLISGILTHRISVVGLTAVIYLIFGSFGIANSVYHARQNAKLQNKLEESIAGMYALRELYNDRTNNNRVA